MMEVVPCNQLAGSFWAFSVDLVLMGVWRLNGSYNQICLVEQKFILLSPCIISVPTTLFMSPTGNDRSGWRNQLTGIHRMGHHVHFIIKILLCWGHALVSIYIEHKYLHIFLPFRVIYPYTSSPNFFVINYLIMVLLSLWLSNQTIGYSPQIRV